MQVCVSSSSGNYVWTRGGENISYRKTNIKTDNKHLYCLTFTFDFKTENNITYFSYSYPYTYSKLDNLLLTLEDQHPSILKSRSIGTSMGGTFLLNQATVSKC